MPRQQGLGCDDCGYLCEDFPAQLLRLGSKSSPLIIRKAESPTADLLPHNAIFFDQIINDLVLSLVQPTRKGNDKKRKWIQTRPHPRSLTRVASLLARKTHGWIFGHYVDGCSEKVRPSIQRNDADVIDHLRQYKAHGTLESLFISYSTTVWAAGSSFLLRPVQESEE